MSEPAHVLVLAHQTAASRLLLEAVRDRARRSPATFHLVVPKRPHGIDKLVDTQHTGTDEAQWAYNPGAQLREILSRLFAARGWGRRQERLRLEEAWAAAVGAEHAPHTSVGNIRRGTLEVVVDNAVLLQELAHYHKRNNVESAVSMVKRKFGDHVRSRTDMSMKNEALCKLVAHNLCCVIMSQCELGIEAEFWPELPAAEADPNILPMVRPG